MNWKKELQDQSAHLIAGAAAVLPAAMIGLNPLTGAWATFCIGFAREVTEWQCSNVIKGQLLEEIDNMDLSDYRQVGNLLLLRMNSSHPWSAGSLRDLLFWAASGFLVGLLI